MYSRAKDSKTGRRNLETFASRKAAEAHELQSNISSGVGEF
jgi:hypothetical protein